jgi:oxygen-independent coproporphyrinogen-3 oxidase
MPNSLTNLLNLYSVPGGRYTYYPTHAGWKNNLNYFQWYDVVKANYNQETGLDLYLHIPFCQSLCTFCGCNIRITKSYQDIAPYLTALKKEWKLYKNFLGDDVKINSIYIGGGTPNFLNASDLDELLTHFSEKSSPHISIELDPRFLTSEQLDVFKKHNVHTLSFGVQDFNQEVLANVNREQDSNEIISLIKSAKDLGFPHINVDLIYGLNHQTPQSLIQTISTLQTGVADSIAIYPFAKVPWQNNSQKAFGDFKDFTRVEMNQLFGTADSKLREQGYIHIGMGHYAHLDSELLDLFKNKKVKRNIMGYTLKKSNLLIGLGVSAFSTAPTGHTQNEKVLEQYLLSIQKDRAPIYKSHTVNADELYLATLFEKIICENYFTKSDREKILASQEANFNMYINNKFIEQKDDQFLVTETGRYFLKNICQCWG